MKNRIILLILTLPFLTMCNTTFLNHKDYRFRAKDFVWNIKVEGQVGEIYIKEPNTKESNFIFGRNWDSTFLVISPDNGAILDTLHPYTIEKEKEYQYRYLNNIPVDKQKYSGASLETVDRQYRGDEETYYLIVKTLSNKEFKILFSRRHFFSVHDILYYKDGKFIMVYNAESGISANNIPYKLYIGLIDLEKIIKH
ncbi:MAG: hypothetical protein WC699_14565 [Bacteroidales bacterium]